MTAPALALLAVTPWVMPWVLLPLVVLLRMRGVTLLETFSASAPAQAPLVSVIVPARNEAHNIELCLASILASRWPAFEVIAVDDGSSDGTGALVEELARTDARLRAIQAPPLPADWFGKQWACHSGVAAATGEYLLFTDADTRHAADLLTRAMNAMHARGADLFSVGGAQVMGSFWERLIQPHIFWLLAARYGNPDAMSRSVRPVNKIANGQFILVSRATYTAEGGHAAVRGHVAEDLRMAQEWTRRGRSVQLMITTNELSTRMYQGFREVVRGWGKNLFAGGRDTVALGPASQHLLRFTLPLPALWEIAPAAFALLWAAGWVGAAAGMWGVAAYACNTVARALVHHTMRAPLWMAALNPLASLVVLGIAAGASWRGSNVSWKDRSYTSS